MTPEETTRVIAAAGGDTKFGELLGIDQDEGFQQRINNWKRRGMPATVELENLDLIRSLQAQAVDHQERCN